MTRTRTLGPAPALSRRAGDRPPPPCDPTGTAGL